MVRKNLENRKDDELSSISENGGVKMKKIRRPYTIDDRKVWITGDSEQQVSEQYAEMLMDARGILPKARQKVLFCDLLDSWFEYKKSHNQIGIQTARAYTSHLKAIKEYFKGKTVNQVTWQSVQAFLDNYLDKSRSSARHKKIIIAQALQWAVSDGVIAVNPAKDSRIIIQQKARKRNEVPFQAYLGMIDKINLIAYMRDRALFALIAFTGMRRGEALALRWQDIDWVGGVINIKRTIVYDGNKPVVKDPKTDAGIRAYPIIPQLKDVLAPMRKDIGFIVSVDGLSPLGETGYCRAWERICKQVNLEGYTAHQFRHTVVSILASSPNISPKTTQTMAGHSDFSTTMDVYAKTEVETLLTAGRIFTEMIQKRLTI